MSVSCISSNQQCTLLLVIAAAVACPYDCLWQLSIKLSCALKICRRHAVPYDAHACAFNDKALKDAQPYMRAWAADS